MPHSFSYAVSMNLEHSIKEGSHERYPDHFQCFRNIQKIKYPDFQAMTVPKNTPRSYNNEDYVPPRVYDPESPHRTPHTHSMGSPQVSETEPASQTTPPATPRKPHHQRKPKHFVVKEKVYKIRQGARHTYKCCSFCHEKFESQKELNSHVSGVHSFCFLCKRRICGKEFSSKAALVKHALCHQLPCYRCTICGSGFQFEYQLKDHSNTHTPIFR